MRFKDQDGNDFPEWKNMKLGDIGEVKMCRRIFNDETSLTGEIPFLKLVHLEKWLTHSYPKNYI